MNSEQTVYAVASDLRDAWLRKPCWLELAKYIVGRVEEIPSDQVEPKTTLEDILDSVFGPPVEDPDQMFRILNEGEVIQKNDQFLSDGKWREIGDTTLTENVVQSPDSPIVPQGYYRRPIENETEATCEEHDFGWALDRLREGKFVCRVEWCGGVVIGLAPADGPLLPTILLDDCGQLSPYFPDHTDLLATDWTLA